MSKINEQDIDGCNYTMSILTQKMRITNWEHTSNPYAKYDVDISATTRDNPTEEVHIMDENKDRRWGWKTIYEDGEKISVRDYDKPQFISSYPSQMFNYEKYEPMMSTYESSGIPQFYTAGYQDGVILFDLATLPKELIYTDADEGGWRIKTWIKETTMDGNSIKKEQYRFLIPNDRGLIFYK